MRKSRLRRRYGRHGSMYPRADFRPIDELLEAQGAQTVRVPTMTMREQVEHDRLVRAVREAEMRRGLR